MNVLSFDVNEKLGKFKILNATNGGPWHQRHKTDQYRSNFADYKAARIPYSRNHDSNCCGQVYGGPFVHDVSVIFPNFDADENNPESYDFACTDEDILRTLDAGTETFFRLGQTIEHQIKKHDTRPPKDFAKWSRICEHIIRHYNEGWANGFTLNIKYWEIWNEADMMPDEVEDKYKLTWGGTKAQFFDFFATAAKHLKTCFPNLKIGGPALCGNECWANDFLIYMKERDISLDFFSWHIYCVEPKQVIEKAERIRTLLDKHGYTNTESILNEWNYIIDWEANYVNSLKAIHGVKGATFAAAVMCEAQKSSIDMLMYYDTRASIICGAFDFYTCEKLKGYYAFYWYGMFYDMVAEIRPQKTIDDIYTICGITKDEKTLTLIDYYTDKKDEKAKEISIDFARKGKYKVYLVDETRNGELITTTDTLTFTLVPNSMLLIKEI